MYTMQLQMGLYEFITIRTILYIDFAKGFWMNRDSSSYNGVWEKNVNITCGRALLVV